MGDNKIPQAVIYGSPGCVQCDMTKKTMDSEGIAYNYLDVTANETAAAQAKALATGTQLPLVVAGNKQWQGFSPDRIRGLK